MARAASLLAVATLGLLLVGSYRGALDSRLREAGAGPELRQAAVSQATRLTDLKLPPDTSAQARDAVKTAFGDAFRAVALACGALGVLGGVAGGLLLGGVRKGDGDEG